MLTHLDVARLQVFDNEGKILDGGKLYFFALQTTTPKPTYQDINGTAYNTNPVILDSVGSSQIYLNGSYTVSATDKYDVSIGPPVDILGGINDFITSAGSGGFASNILVSVDNYASLRSLSTNYAWVFVQGRETNADGGQGIFYFSTTPGIDDDGITINSQAGTYIRYDVTKIDPRWFGLVYDSLISQQIYIEKSQVASERYNKPIDISGKVYLNSNYTTSANESSWIITGEFVSTLPITFTFTSNNKIVEIGKEVFGNTVQPKFEENVLEKIKYTIFGASDEEGRMEKCLASTSANYFLDLDKSIELTTSLEIPENFTLEVNSTTLSGAIFFNTSDACNLYIPKLKESYENIVRYKEISTIGDVNVGNNFISPEFFCYNLSGTDQTSIVAALKNGKTSFKTGDYTLTTNLTVTSADILGYNAKFVVSADFSSPNFNFENITLETVGNLTGTIFTASDCIISGGNYIFSETILKDVSTNSIFIGNLTVENCTFEDMISYATYLKKAKNTNFGKLACLLNNAEIDNIKASDPVFYINFENIIKNSIFTTDKEIHYMSKGVGGNLTINNSELYNIVPSDNSSVKYYINNCVGNFIESNSIINSKQISATSLGSTILTSATTGFIAVSGNTSGSYSTISNNLTTDSNFIIFSTSGNYDYIDSTSATKILVYNSSANNILKNFKLYGGKVSIETQTSTSSDFKICFITPDFRVGSCNIKTSGSLSANSNKIFNETFKINSDVKMSECFWNGVSNIQPNFLTYPKTLTDRFSTYSKVISNSATIVDDNFQIVFYGYIEAGTKIKIEIEANIPQNQETFETYYEEIAAKENTRETITNQFSFISSGTNYVSDKWIFSPEFTKDNERIYIKGFDPTLYINSRFDSFQYILSEGASVGSDPDAFVYGYWTYKKELLNPGLLNPNLYINLSVKTSGDTSGFYIPALTYTDPVTAIYTSGYYTINSEETVRNSIGGALHTDSIQRRLDVFPDKYEKVYGSNKFRRFIKQYFTE